MLYLIADTDILVHLPSLLFPHTYVLHKQIKIIVVLNLHFSLIVLANIFP